MCDLRQLYYFVYLSWVMSTQSIWKTCSMNWSSIELCIDFSVFVFPISNVWQIGSRSMIAYLLFYWSKQNRKVLLTLIKFNCKTNIENDEEKDKQLTIEWKQTTKTVQLNNEKFSCDRLGNGMNSPIVDFIIHNDE